MPTGAFNMDRFSKLPVGLIETILCLVPIQEAARTSILSRDWRYHWIKIPKLTFDERTFQVSTDGADPSKRAEMSKRCRFFYAIYQLLLMHQGPIHEFTLRMEVDDSCVEIDHLILQLSRKNTVKILRLDLSARNYEGYRIPLSLLSLHHLTEMYLYDCSIYHVPPFTDFKFGCITTLFLRRISAYDNTLLRLLSSCPSLKRLTLHSDGATIIETGVSTIVDLFKCLPGIEYLSVRLHTVECFIPERLPKELPTKLVHLKCFRIKFFCFSHKYGLPFLVLLIRSSPNLEKLEIVIDGVDWPDEEDIGSFTLEDYSDIMLEHLKELEITNFADIEYESDFVNLVLARSPVLKKVRIFSHRCLDEDEVSEISKTLLCSPCASPVVKITAHHLW